MKHLIAAPAILLIAFPATARPETVTIYRDTWGVPNIYAQTEEGACFGMGYAQAEDRLGQIFENYRRALGRMAEVAGPGELFNDYRSRLWRHAEVAREGYPKLSAKVRACLEAYQAGVRQYMKEHPDRVPDSRLEIEPWMCVALGRLVIWGWPEGQAYEELVRAGVRIEPPEYRGSNQMVLAPSRTADGVAMAVIDPHLGFYGVMRFYEARLYGGAIQAAGIAVTGLPFPSLGHNAYLSVAMTTGGPDTADVFTETLNPENPRQYRYDGQWRTGTLETIRIQVRKPDGTMDTVERQVLYTHHGPVVATREGQGYAMALSYFQEYALAEQSYRMLLARNLTEAKDALAMCQLMPQNVMIATVDGDIYYQRTGRVPIRPDGYDYTKPVPGDTSATEWKGIHPASDLVQITNPPAGYMQNCNVSPRVMFRDSPMTPDRYKSYLYMEPEHNGIKYGLHQRAAMTFEQLDQIRRATVQDVIEIATSTQVYGAKAWQNRLREAWEKADAQTRDDSGLRAFAEAILSWNGRVEKDSAGVLCYYYWKQAQSSDIRLRDRLGAPPPATLSDATVIETLKAGRQKMIAECGRTDVRYGDIFRAGRQGGKRTAPVDGGGLDGIATPRNLSFGDRNADGKRLMRGGQCALQVVQLSKPPKSWTAAPLGQSDDPASKHFDDQAIELVASRKLKPTYFLNRDELMKNVESTRQLEYAR